MCIPEAQTLPASLIWSCLTLLLWISMLASGGWALVAFLLPSLDTYKSCFSPEKLMFHHSWGCSAVIYCTRGKYSDRKLKYLLSWLSGFKIMWNWDVSNLCNHPHTAPCNSSVRYTHVWLLRLCWRQLSKDYGALIINPLLATFAEQISGFCSISGARHSHRGGFMKVPRHSRLWLMAH